MAESIRNQPQKDAAIEQIIPKESVDPFRGSKNK